MNNITQWSYSRHEAWAQCPRKAYYQFVEKLPQGPPGEALVRGRSAHEICAEVYRGKWPKGDHLPVSEGWRHILSQQRNFYGTDLEAELQIAFDAMWQPTGWFDKQTVYRCIFDGMAYTPARNRVLQIYEHKTGKVRESHKGQASWYAGVGSILVPDAEEIHVDVHYLDLPVTSPMAVMRTKQTQFVARQMLLKWEEKAQEMMADTEFPTRAGYHCRWCPYRNSAGGPCALG